jgi:excisionase family DNA binding protein
LISLDIFRDMPEDQSPLFVRLALDAARRLDDAAASSGLSKRQIVEDAVREHLGEGGKGLVVGRVALREPQADVLTPGEAATLLRVGEDAVLAAAESGELPGRRIGEEWRFAREALLAWLSEPRTVG